MIHIKNTEKDKYFYAMFKNTRKLLGFGFNGIQESLELKKAFKADSLKELKEKFDQLGILWGNFISICGSDLEVIGYEWFGAHKEIVLLKEHVLSFSIVGLKESEIVPKGIIREFQETFDVYVTNKQLEGNWIEEGEFKLSDRYSVVSEGYYFTFENIKDGNRVGFKVPNHYFQKSLQIYNEYVGLV